MHSLFVLLCVFDFALIMYLSFFFGTLPPGCFGLARFLVVVGWLFTLCDTHTLHDATGWQSLALNL
jgi:hypothetical protein